MDFTFWPIFCRYDKVLKKRLIFTLLYNQGQFVLSRNFRLQNVGDLKWLQSNYDFTHIACAIDELIVLDVSREGRDYKKFCSVLSLLTKKCFVPIAAGGGIRTMNHAYCLLRSGADKIVINTPLFTSDNFVEKLAHEFGEQCVVASLDLQRDSGGSCHIVTESGTKRLEEDAGIWIERISQKPIGDIYLNSIDRDGTGQGYDLSLLDRLPRALTKPVILGGGAGNVTHLFDGLSDRRTDAVSTAHLFNFVGNGLQLARSALVEKGVSLPIWG